MFVMKIQIVLNRIMWGTENLHFSYIWWNMKVENDRHNEIYFLDTGIERLLEKIN